mgnify:CR=1 FL=1
MTVIYSRNRVEGVKGFYADPSLFNGDTENCHLVYTDSKEIQKAYELKGIKVEPITKKKEPRASK